MNNISVNLVCNDKPSNIDSTHIKNVIGQEEAKSKLSFLIETHTSEFPIDTLLFTGSQGLGKTFMAQKVADSMGRKLIEVNCGSYSSADEFIEKVLLEQVAGQEPKTILLDESQKLSWEITNILLTLLNPNSKNVNTYKYKNIEIIYDLTNINVIFATTDAHMMFTPLLNRCTEIYFHPYTDDEIKNIIKMYLGEINIVCECQEIVKNCRKRARNAFRLSQNMKRCCHKYNSKTFDFNMWKFLEKTFNFMPEGLNSQEVQLLKVLKECQPISLKNLSTRMGLNQDNVESELELWPRELGFIDSGSRGQFLTKNGEEYLKKIV